MAAGRRGQLGVVVTARAFTALLVLAIATPAEAGSKAGSAAAENPFRGRRLYVNPSSPARKQADAWRRSRPDDAARMQRMAEHPLAAWLGDWDRDIRRATETHMAQASRAGAIPVFVAYNIPYRDCGLHSRGGARTADDYRRWILGIARGLNNRPSVVILEPDAIAAITCLPARLRDERYVLIREAADVLTTAGASVYIDAGHPSWQPAAEMAQRLTSAGIARAEGFALNVSNFHSTSSNVAYGDRLSRLVGGKHYVIDTSRNGRGGAVGREWCNPPNQAVGHAPTISTGLALVDAFLWIKTPGQSDGTCNNGPRAGEWWPEYALGLIRTAESLGSLTQR